VSESPILLDTCAAMFLIADEWMSEAACKAIGAAAVSGAPLHVSPIAAWEVGMMTGKGRFRSALTPERWWTTLLSRPGIALCALTAEILMQSWSLPGRLNKDPADRIIAATAREHGYTVLTRDCALLAYGEEGHIRALAC
jgi:PIN domain nuclease of toxin-antitoxin system